MLSMCYLFSILVAPHPSSFIYVGDEDTLVTPPSRCLEPPEAPGWAVPWLPGPCSPEGNACASSCPPPLGCMDCQGDRDRCHWACGGHEEQTSIWGSCSDPPLRCLPTLGATWMPLQGSVAARLRLGSLQACPGQPCLLGVPSPASTHSYYTLCLPWVTLPTYKRI
jgi:hypothetical protein